MADMTDTSDQLRERFEAKVLSKPGFKAFPMTLLFENIYENPFLQAAWEGFQAALEGEAWQASARETQPAPVPKITTDEKIYQLLNELLYHTDQRYVEEGFSSSIYHLAFDTEAKPIVEKWLISLSCVRETQPQAVVAGNSDIALAHSAFLSNPARETQPAPDAIQRQLEMAEKIIQLACDVIPYEPNFTNALMEYDRKYGVMRSGCARETANPAEDIKNG